MNMFISASTRVRPAETANSSVCVYRNETNFATRVAQGKILTVTERFSEFNSYNACKTSLMAKNRTCKLAVLKNVL